MLTGYSRFDTILSTGVLFKVIQLYINGVGEVRSTMARKYPVLLKGVVITVIIWLAGWLGTEGFLWASEAYAAHKEKKQFVGMVEQMEADVISALGEDGAGRYDSPEADALLHAVIYLESDNGSSKEASKALPENIPAEEWKEVLTSSSYSLVTKRALLESGAWDYEDESFSDMLADILEDERTSEDLKWLVVEYGDGAPTHRDRLAPVISRMFSQAGNYRQAYGCGSFMKSVCVDIQDMVKCGETLSDPAVDDAVDGKESSEPYALWLRQCVDPVMRSPGEYPDYIKGAAGLLLMDLDPDDREAEELTEKVFETVPFSPDSAEMLTDCCEKLGERMTSGETTDGTSHEPDSQEQTEKQLDALLAHLRRLIADKDAYTTDQGADLITAAARWQDAMVRLLLDSPTEDDINGVIACCNGETHFLGTTPTPSIDSCAKVRPVLINVMAQQPEMKLDRLEYRQIQQTDDGFIQLTDLDMDGLEDRIRIYSYAYNRENMLEVTFGSGQTLAIPAEDPLRLIWEDSIQLYMRDTDGDGTEELLVLGVYSVPGEREKKQGARYNLEEGKGIGASVYKRDENGQYSLTAIDGQWDIFFPASGLEYVKPGDISRSMADDAAGLGEVRL